MTTLHTQTTLAAELRALGVRPGDVIMPHVSLRAVGPIEGGGDALLAALFDVLGPQGTVLMVIDADPDEPFDALNTPVDTEDMGVLAELFRCTRGVAVNDHVASRFAAWGAARDALLAPSPLDDYFSTGSVLERFLALKGRVLRLGPDIDTTTLTHHAEYLARVPNKRRVVRVLRRADIGDVRVESLDDTHGIADWEGGDYFSHIMLDYLRQGGARVGPVGACQAELIEGDAFTRFAVAWMERELQHNDAHHRARRAE